MSKSSTNTAANGPAQADLMRTAKSWRGKPIRDAKVNEIGLAVGAVETEEGVRVVARFPSDPKTDRYIALEPTDDLECLVPDMVKARYRAPRPEEIAALKAKRSAA